MTDLERNVEYGYRAIERGTPDYESNRELGDHDTNVVDVLANIMHYCDTMGVDFHACVTSAENHHSAEVLEETYDRKGD